MRFTVAILDASEPYAKQMFEMRDQVKLNAS